jgi:organic radical activating enzyme
MKMTIIYVANGTKQRLKFNYRLPESNRIHELDVHSGRQEQIGEGWTDTNIEYFIKQLENAGFRRSSETNGRLENFSGWMYSVDKATSETQIRSGHEARVEAQEKISAVEAQRGALAMDQANRVPGNRRKRLAKVTSVEVQQDVDPSKSATGNEVNMSVSVDASAPESARLDI